MAMMLVSRSSHGGGMMAHMFFLLLLLSACTGRQNSFRKVVVSRRVLVDEGSFQDDCRAGFTSDSVVEDGLISQNEYTSVIVDLCGLDGVECELLPNPTFSGLSLSLALAFLGQVCTEFASREECIAEVLSTAGVGGEFGLNVDQEEVSGRIQELCSVIFSDVVVTPDTASPTASTPSPTLVPSLSPTSPTSPVGGSGAVTSGPPPAPKGLSSDDSLSSGAIVGIACGSAAAFAVIALLLARRKRNRKSNDQELPQAIMEVKGDESIFTENSRELYVVPTQTAGSTFDEGSDDSPAVASRGLQSADTELFNNVSTIDERATLYFDPSSAGGVIVEGQREGEQPQSGATGLQQKVNALDHAIDIGDWDAVYKISSTLSDKDDLSSHRSGSSTGSSTRGRKRLTAEDQAKAAKLENLVELGDWEAVATMAATFSNASSSEVSLASSIYNDSEGESDARVGAVPRKADSPRFDEAAAKFAEVRESEDAKSAGTAENVPSSPPRRFLMDFVGHGGNSSAAAGALSIQDGNEGTGIIGASPRGTTEAAGKSAATKGAAAAIIASDSDDEKKGHKRKNSWRNFFSKRGSEDFMVDNMENTPGPFDSDGEVAAVNANIGIKEASVRSSPISSGMSTPIDPEMTQEFERMIAANDWKGLAEMAAQEVDSTSGERGVEDVNLRPTPKLERGELGPRKFPSMHGAKVLIPFWEKLIDEVEAEKKAGLGAMDDQDETDLRNDELIGKGEAPEHTPEKSAPSSPVAATSHTKETYDAAAAFAKAWNNLKEDPGDDEEAA